jgi:hypothetical protein
VIKYRTLILPWASLGGVVVALSALLLVRLQIWDDERVVLWPTYQLLHLEIWHGPNWDFALFFLLVQALVWTILLFTVAAVARWALRLSRRSRNDGAA